jgi:hypothetical protein
MKNKNFLKLAGLASTIAILASFFPASMVSAEGEDSGFITINGTVTGGVALTAGDNVSMTVDPANKTDGVDTDDTSTDDTGNTLTVWNNDVVDGFVVTVKLVGGDLTDPVGGTHNTLGIATTTNVLDNVTNGFIKFKSTLGDDGLFTGLTTGTGEDTFTLYTSDAEHVFDSMDPCAQATISVDHELTANVEVVPGIYTGTATYTIAVNV